MHVNATLIKTVSAQLTDMLGDDFDPETFWDTLDGETDVIDLIDKVLRIRGDAKTLAAATKAQADEYAARAKRIGERAGAMDKALLTILDATGQKSVERPLGTVSRRKGSMSVNIVDAGQIPSQLCKTTVVPDKAEIGSQIKAGVAVPGAELHRGPDSVTVRVK